MKIYPASFIHRLASSLQTARKQSKISKVTCIQTVHIYIYVYVEETFRERKGRMKKGEADIYIYIYTRAKQGRNYPRGETTVGACGLSL